MDLTIMNWNIWQVLWDIFSDVFLLGWINNGGRRNWQLLHCQCDET